MRAPDRCARRPTVAANVVHPVHQLPWRTNCPATRHGAAKPRPLTRGDYLEYHQRPLLERDPLKAWKILCDLLALTQLATLILFLR